MILGLERTVDPAEYVCTLQEAKARWRLENDDVTDDADVMAFLAAATDVIEHRTGRALITQTWEASFDAFPLTSLTPIVLPKPPLQSVTSIVYTDGDGASQTWSSADYQVDTKRARIRPAFNTTYPGTRSIMNAVTVTYVAGYGLKSAVSDTLKAAVLMLGAHLFAHREENVVGTSAVPLPFGVEALIGPWKVVGF